MVEEEERYKGRIVFVSIPIHHHINNIIIAAFSQHSHPNCLIPTTSKQALS